MIECYSDSDSVEITFRSFPSPHHSLESIGRDSLHWEALFFKLHKFVNNISLTEHRRLKKGVRMKHLKSGKVVNI